MAMTPRKPDPYRLAPRTPLLELPGAREVVVAPTLDMVIDTLAADMVVHGLECVREFGDYHIALSGGSTPEPLYERLMYDPQYRMLPWRKTHLWIVDERIVPFEDERSNFRMINEIIVDHADIPAEQVHPIFALSPNADEEYEQQLRENLEWREKGQDRLDFVLLGMGADGHTASLFPCSEAIGEATRLVRINRGGETPPPGRVTMTYPLINAARYVAVLASGASKAPAVARVKIGLEKPDTLPIAGVRLTGGELKWYLDAAAAGVPDREFKDLSTPAIDQEGDAPPFVEDEFRNA